MTASSLSRLNTTYTIGPFALDARRQLRESGRPVKLGGRALDVLSVLAEAGGGLVTKDELMSAVWPDVHIEENAIQVHVSAARKALGGEAGRLVTVHGKGYRLEIDSAPSVETEKSVAVLAFVNLTGDEDHDYLADGLAEEVITTLSRRSDIRVPARTSSFAYRGKDVDAREIAMQLGVSHVLEGSVRVSDGRLRVTAQLIDGATGFHIWAQNFERAPDELFALQDDVSSAIVRSLQANLLPTFRHVPDKEAFNLNALGRALAGRTTADALVRAIDLQERAVARDPLFAAGWAGLAGTLMVSTMIGVVPMDRRAYARARAEEAIRLDPAYAAPYAIRAVLDSAAGRWFDAEIGFRTASEIEPEEPTAIDAAGINLWAPLGHIRHATILARRAYGLAPGSWQFSLRCGHFAAILGEVAAARDHCDLATMLGASEDNGVMLMNRSCLAAAEGRFEEAGQKMGGSLALSNAMREARCQHIVALAHSALAGDADKVEARKAIKGLILMTDHREGLWRFPAMAGHLLRLLVLLGDVDGAYDLTDRMLSAWRVTGQLATLSLYHVWRTELLPFRNDPRFASLVEQLGMPAFWASHGPPDGYRLDQGRLVPA